MKIKKNKTLIKSLVSFVLTIVFSVSIMILIVRAGDLNPSSTPGSSMKTLEQIYNPLAGSFDSSGITASSTGSALEIVQCAITKIQGGTCP